MLIFEYYTTICWYICKMYHSIFIENPYDSNGKKKAEVEEFAVGNAPDEDLEEEPTMVRCFCMKTFKLHLIRHGLTAGNLQGLYIGSGTDIPLCDEGRAQLAELKERFEYPQVDTVFSSPLLVAGSHAVADEVKLESFHG